MKGSQSKKETFWQKRRLQISCNTNTSGIYFARAKVHGKLIRQSLETSVLSIAKLKLSDVLKKEHQRQESAKALVTGKMTFEECWLDCKRRTEQNPNIKASTQKYHDEILASVYKSWPELKDLDVRRSDKAACLNWQARFVAEYSSTRMNGAISLLRRVLEIAVESGIRYDNPATRLKRSRIRQKDFSLPEQQSFLQIIEHVQNAGGRFSRHCADLIQFLAFGGFRISKAAQITWADCDFKRGEILMRGYADRRPEEVKCSLV